MSTAKTAKVKSVAGGQSVPKKAKAQKSPKTEIDDKLNSGDIPLGLENRKKTAEENGWIFEQDTDGMLDAANPESRKYCGKHSSLFALLNQIEGETTGDHTSIINRLGLFNPPPPDFDVEAFTKAMLESGSNSDYDPDDENNATPAETRINYFYETIGVAEHIRQVEAGLPSLKPKERKKAEADIARNSAGLPGYLANAHNFFGKESADYLRGKLALFGFVFDDDYSLLLNFVGESESDSIDSSTTEGQIQLQQNSVRHAKFFELIKEVLIGVENWNRVAKELETKYGKDWYNAVYRLSKSEFRQEVRDLWLGDCDGDEESLTKEFRTPHPAIITAGTVSPLTAIEIDINQIVPSPFKPQQSRRERFRDWQTEELAQSIKKDGLINPISVRPVLGDAFEIIAGERRWLAVKKAGLSTITAFVKSISDDAAFDIQVQENLQRVDAHPLDEAASYQYLIEEKNSTVADLMARFGKGEEYIKSRLKLNDLAATVIIAFQNDEITFSHALELAKYPTKSQKELLEYCYTNYGYASQSLLSVPRLVAKIQEHYLLRLSKAPFSTKSKELRADGLACVECPQRTGAEPLLFKEGIGKNDSCLNRKCWEGKVQTHIQIQRSAVVAGDYVRDEQKPKEGFVGRWDFKELKKSNECASGETGVYFNGDRTGQKVHLCRDPKCKTHGSSFSSTSSSSGKSVEDMTEERRIRREELFDVRVGAVVRVNVLKACAEKFNGLQTTESELLRPIAERMWLLQHSRDSAITEALAPIVAGFFKIDTENGLLSKVNQSVQSDLEQLDAGDVRKIVFLVLHGTLDPMFFFEKRGYSSDRFVSQKNIRSLAEEYEVDYQLLDARTRLAQAPMKHKEMFRSYLETLESGDRQAKLPRMFSEGWKPKE